MWTCPACRRRFANTNQWHACTDLSVDEHLAGRSELAVSLYRAVEQAVADCGTFRVHAQQTRIAFIETMTFGGVKLARGWVDVSFITPQPIDDPRIRRLEVYGPTSFGSTIRLSALDELDADVRHWLCDAYGRGTQETLDPGAEVEPLVGHALAVAVVPLASRVTADGHLHIPAWAAACLSEAPSLDARLEGDHHTAHLVDTGDGQAIGLDGDVLAALGLGEGDRVDVVLRDSRWR